MGYYLDPIQKVTGQNVTIYMFHPGGQKVTGQKVTTYIFA
jgi:predicted naringenin-chalcone synthase